MRTVAVVLNWRRPDDTLRCVASLLAINRPLDIVVVDNASGDGSLEAIATGLERMPARLAAGAALINTTPDQYNTWPTQGRAVLLTDSGRNGGYAFGNNVGLRLALARPDVEYLWVLNNDITVPTTTTLDALLARMEEDSSIGICGATVTYLDAPEKVQTLAGGRFQPALGRCHPIGFGTTLNETIDRDVVEAQLAYVNGAAAFVRRGYVEQIGLMREDYFLYFEEFDWAIRGRGKFRLGYAPDAVVLHEVGASIGTDDFGNASPLSTYYLTRNRLKFLWRFAPASLPGAIADTMLEAARAARQGRWDYVRTVVCASTGLPFRALAQ